MNFSADNGSNVGALMILEQSITSSAGRSQDKSSSSWAFPHLQCKEPLNDVLSPIGSQPSMSYPILSRKNWILFSSTSPEHQPREAGSSLGWMDGT